MEISGEYDMVSNVELKFQIFRNNSNGEFHFIHARANKTLEKVGNGIPVKPATVSPEILSRVQSDTPEESWKV